MSNKYVKFVFKIFYKYTCNLKIKIKHKIVHIQSKKLNRQIKLLKIILLTK